MISSAVYEFEIPATNSRQNWQERGNPLTSLPESLIALPRLEKLDLRWVTTLETPRWFSQLEANGCIIYS
jgi:hypothetical protein